MVKREGAVPAPSAFPLQIGHETAAFMYTLATVSRSCSSAPCADSSQV